MPELSLRPALVQDAREIACVQHESWVEAYRQLLPAGFPLRDEEERVTLWQQRVMDHPCHTLVAEIDGAIVGFIFWEPVSSVMAEISSLYLHPFVWRRGIGRQLLEQVALDMRLAGFLRVGLWVMSGNIRAERFYLSLAFQYDGQTRQRKAAWQGGYVQRHMVRSL